MAKNVNKGRQIGAVTTFGNPLVSFMLVSLNTSEPEYCLLIYQKIALSILHFIIVLLLISHDNKNTTALDSRPYFEAGKI